MSNKSPNVQRSLEFILVLIVVALTCLLFKTTGLKMIVLNLFYLPVVLAAFFLGRYRAGVLALFCVISASIVVVMDMTNFAAINSPIVVGLSLTIWGAVLGLTTLLVGTLSDERTLKMLELHEAHVGVVEVLSRYLQSANPKLKDRSNRVSEISQAVAEQMKLSPREIDDIRVAALLQDMENIEITARVIKKAMGDLGDEKKGPEQHTFHGTELVRSLGTVLTGAFPLLLSQGDGGEFNIAGEGFERPADIPFGARIIRTVRAFDALMDGDFGLAGGTPLEAVEELQSDVEADYHPAVIHALKHVASRSKIFAAATAVLSAEETETLEAVAVEV